MQTKELVRSSNYKQLSKHAPWKKVYINEKPWREMSVDVDSLVFFYMRKYLDKPYATHRDETMVCAAFVYDIRTSRQLVVEDMVRYSVNKLAKTVKFLNHVGIKTHLVYSMGIPSLKEDLYEERLRHRARVAQQIHALNVVDDRYRILALVKEYMLHFRDNVRDIVVQHSNTLHFHTCQEADKWCGKGSPITMSEDVDVFLFGHDRTIIVKPLLMDETPTHLDFLDCKSYYIHNGISTHQQFIQVCIMIGTDYNYGVKGMGPKTSVTAITKYGTIARYMAVKYDLSDENVARFMARCNRTIKYIRTLT